MKRTMIQTQFDDARALSGDLCLRLNFAVGHVSVGAKGRDTANLVIKPAIVAAGVEHGARSAP